ncbi:MAG: hypothetical protein J0I09_10535 [Sphingobacteriia bacterium]|nr:hypothetical protein [Sphingobacteriia bacterium]
MKKLFIPLILFGLAITNNYGQINHVNKDSLSAAMSIFYHQQKNNMDKFKNFIKEFDQDQSFWINEYESVIMQKHTDYLKMYNDIIFIRYTLNLPDSLSIQYFDSLIISVKDDYQKRNFKDQIVPSAKNIKENTTITLSAFDKITNYQFRTYVDNNERQWLVNELKKYSHQSIDESKLPICDGYLKLMVNTAKKEFFEKKKNK